MGIKFTPFAIGHGSRFADFLGQIRWKCPPALTLARQPFCRRCEPAYPVRTRSVHQIAKNASTGAASRHPTGMPGANCKPCKPCFALRRWRNAALSPPALDFRQEGPLLPSAYLFPATTTIEGDRHHRHIHHRRDDGDRCDGHTLLFASPETQDMPASDHHAGWRLPVVVRTSRHQHT